MSLPTPLINPPLSFLKAALPNPCERHGGVPHGETHHEAAVGHVFEYAATQRVTLLEWHRFAVNHYHDERMEEARRECVRIIQRAKRGEVPRVDVERLYSIAAALRASEWKSE